MVRVLPTTPFAAFFEAEHAKHRRDAHLFVDRVFDNDQTSEEGKFWRRALSALMELEKQHTDAKNGFGTSPSLERFHQALEDATER